MFFSSLVLLYIVLSFFTFPGMVKANNGSKKLSLIAIIVIYGGGLLFILFMNWKLSLGMLNFDLRW